MSWTLLSKAEHSGKAIVRERSFSFAQKEIVTSLCSFELYNAVSYLPIVFAKEKEKVGVYGLMGLEKDKNLFVSNQGKWELPNFIPAAFSVYPFRVGVTPEGQNLILIKDDSDLIVDKDAGQALFEKDGDPTDTLKYYLTLLARIQNSNKIVEKACSLLWELNLLEVFSLKIPVVAGKNQEMTGLLRINVRNFNALQDEEFLKLKEVHALDFIYAHFCSLGCLSRIAGLMKMKGQSDFHLKDLGTKIFNETEADLDFNLE